MLCFQTAGDPVGPTRSSVQSSCDGQRRHQRASTAFLIGLKPRTLSDASFRCAPSLHAHPNNRQVQVCLSAFNALTSILSVAASIACLSGTPVVLAFTRGGAPLKLGASARSAAPLPPLRHASRAAVLLEYTQDAGQRSTVLSPSRFTIAWPVCLSPHSRHFPARHRRIPASAVPIIYQVRCRSAPRPVMTLFCGRVLRQPHSTADHVPKCSLAADLRP